MDDQTENKINPNQQAEDAPNQANTQPQDAWAAPANQNMGPQVGSVGVVEGQPQYSGAGQPVQMNDIKTPRILALIYLLWPILGNVLGAIIPTESGGGVAIIGLVVSLAVNVLGGYLVYRYIKIIGQVTNSSAPKHYVKVSFIIWTATICLGLIAGLLVGINNNTGSNDVVSGVAWAVFAVLVITVFASFYAIVLGLVIALTLLKHNVSRSTVKVLGIIYMILIELLAFALAFLAYMIVYFVFDPPEE